MTLKVIAGNASPLSSNFLIGGSHYWKVISVLGSEGMEMKVQVESYSKGLGNE